MRPWAFLNDGSPAANRGVNDVKVVQFLLNAIPASEGAPDFLLDVDGIVGEITTTPSVAFSSSSSAS